MNSIMISPDNVSQINNKNGIKTYHVMKVKYAGQTIYANAQCKILIHGFFNSGWCVRAKDFHNPSELYTFFFPRDSFELLLPQPFLSSIRDSFHSRIFFKNINLPDDALEVIRMFLL